MHIAAPDFIADGSNEPFNVIANIYNALTNAVVKIKNRGCGRMDRDEKDTRSD
jgi:hypothetical protein